MSAETKPLRARLQTPIVLIVTRILLPALAIAAMAFLLWTQPLTQTTTTEAGQWWPLMLRYLPILLSSGVIGVGILNLRTQQSASLLAFLSGLFALLAFLSFLFSEVLAQSFNIDLLWNIPFYLITLVALCLLLPFSVTLWQLVAAPLRKELSPLADVGATIVGIIILFVIGIIGANVLEALLIFDDTVWITGVVCFCVLILACVFHILWILGCALSQKINVNPYIKWILQTIGTLLLPIAGLFLNRIIPFPGDLQSPWCYLLTVLTATSLLLPEGTGFKGRMLAFFRWATLPFTLYFFILFLPFAPLALPLMPFIGSGFLLLAPTILLSIHLPALARSTKCFTTRWARWSVALLGFALIPSLIAIPIERDRALVRPLIAAVATPDTTRAEDTLPIPEAAARRIAQALLSRDYTNRAFPLLSHWTDYRLFGGLYPRAEVLNSLARRFNLSYSVRKRRRMWRNIETETAPVTTELRGAGTCKLTLSITIPELKGADEFETSIRLADGVWVTGLRLKMPQGGPWRDGLLCDRRSATWVYERLTERSIDPALLTLDTLTQGTLRVSPVTEPRQVEIDLLLPSPTWCNTPITIGEQAVLLPEGEILSEATPSGATVCFIGTGAEHPLPKAALYVVAAPIITVSEKAPIDLPTEGHVDAQRAFRFAHGNAYVKNLHLTQAIYVGEGWWNKTDFTPMEPKRALPKLAPDEPWQQGAIAAQLAEACLYAPHPEYAEPLREAMKRSGALMPGYAYIVVENETQERALRTLDAIAQHAEAGMDFDTPATVKQSTPSFLCLLLFLLILMCFSKRKTTQGES
jgi:hypothetical protein